MATKTLTAGSTVLVFAMTSSTISASALTISDGVNTYTQRQSFNQPSTNQGKWCWSAGNVAAGSTTITISGLGGYNGVMRVFELIGADAASATSSFDATDSFTQAVTSVYAAGAGGITVASGATAFALYFADRDITALSVSGYTAGTTHNANDLWSYPRWKDFPSGGSSERAAGTLTTNGYTSGLLISIKEAAGGGSSAGAAAHYYRQMQ